MKAEKYNKLQLELEVRTKVIYIGKTFTKEKLTFIGILKDQNEDFLILENIIFGKIILKKIHRVKIIDVAQYNERAY